jgi:5-methylcytosine-specific restriction endonuclease McrA
MNASADGSINARSLQELMNKQNKCCYYCDTPLDFDTIRAIHLDHVIPLSKQGPHIISNVVWSCQTCNISKGVK